MKNGVVISDSGPIISLVVADLLPVLDMVFDQVFIPRAVWNEITEFHDKNQVEQLRDFFQSRLKDISIPNDLSLAMDYGESEAVVLYRELNADYLLIDDKKAREIAEGLDVQCVGTIGLLSIARSKGYISRLRPVFERLLQNNRYYSLNILNIILERHGEEPFSPPAQ